MNNVGVWKSKSWNDRNFKKYNFNEKCLNEFKNAKQGEYCVIDEIIQLLGELHHTDEIKRFPKCYKIKDLSEKKYAELLQICLTWDESGM